MKKEKKILKRLIRNEFDKTDLYSEKYLNNLIKTAEFCGLKKLAKEMNNDLTFKNKNSFGDINLDFLTIYKKNEN